MLRADVLPLEDNLAGPTRPFVRDSTARRAPGVHVLAQCRRSLGGKMKKALEDMAIAELENKSAEDMGGIGGHDFED